MENQLSADTIHFHQEVHLDFRDRIKMLFTGVVRTRSEIDCIPILNHPDITKVTHIGLQTSSRCVSTRVKWFRKRVRHP